MAIMKDKKKERENMREIIKKKAMVITPIKWKVMYRSTDETIYKFSYLLSKNIFSFINTIRKYKYHSPN